MANRTVFRGETHYAFAPIDGRGETRFTSPYGITVDSKGVLYVADTGNNRIQKVLQDGTVTTVAGSPRRGEEGGFADGPALAARFYNPTGITIDGEGVLYIADTMNNHIRKVLPDGTVSTIAGSHEIGREGGFADGPGFAARFNLPQGITIDKKGVLYVADTGNNRIRKILQDGTVTTIAGSEDGFADGPGLAARFSQPRGITIDGEGVLYIADYRNHRIRKVLQDGTVGTIAGSEAGFADGQGAAARFYYPQNITIDKEGVLYVADTLNRRIRKVLQNGTVSWMVGIGTDAEFLARGRPDIRFYNPNGIVIDSKGVLYVSDTDMNQIWKITPQIDRANAMMAQQLYRNSPLEGTEDRARLPGNLMALIGTYAGVDPGRTIGSRIRPGKARRTRRIRKTRKTRRRL